MIRDRLSRRRQRDPAELNITAFLNLMVILVPFLLITAVFTRMAVLELNLPKASEQTEDQDKLRLEIVVRNDALVVGDGRRIVAEVPRTEAGAHDYDQLSTLMQRLKKANPEVRQASILLESDTKYDVLVQVMDAVRMVKQPDPDNPDQTMQAELFPEIALGDAPASGGDRAAGDAG